MMARLTTHHVSVLMLVRNKVERQRKVMGSRIETGRRRMAQANRS